MLWLISSRELTLNLLIVKSNCQFVALYHLSISFDHEIRNYCILLRRCLCLAINPFKKSQSMRKTTRLKSGWGFGLTKHWIISNTVTDGWGNLLFFSTRLKVHSLLVRGTTILSHAATKSSHLRKLYMQSLLCFVVSLWYRACMRSVDPSDLFKVTAGIMSDWYVVTDTIREIKTMETTMKG